MKNVLLSAIVVLGCMAANAFAVDANSSWSEIESAGLKISAPMIGFPGAFESVMGVCLEADGVTLNGGTTTLCTEHAGRSGACVKNETVTLTTSINATEQVCVRSVPRAGCLEYKTVPYQIALNYNLDVSESVSHGRAGTVDTFLFTKAFAVPACAQ